MGAGIVHQCEWDRKQNDEEEMTDNRLGYVAMAVYLVDFLFRTNSYWVHHAKRGVAGIWSPLLNDWTNELFILDKEGYINIGEIRLKSSQRIEGKTLR